MNKIHAWSTLAGHRPADNARQPLNASGYSSYDHGSSIDTAAIQEHDREGSVDIDTSKFQGRLVSSHHRFDACLAPGWRATLQCFVQPLNIRRFGEIRSLSVTTTCRTRQVGLEQALFKSRLVANDIERLSIF